MLLEEYNPKGTMTNKDTYFDTLLCLRNAVKRKRSGKLSQGVLLIHDNTTPHKAAIITFLLDNFGWDVFQYPAHSPDLPPSYYQLFPNLHRWLGKHFNNDDEVKADITSRNSTKLSLQLELQNSFIDMRNVLNDGESMSKTSC